MNKPPTTDRYMLGGVTYQVDLQTKLGAGSEGMVIAHPRDPALCVKLLHPADPGDKKAAGNAAYHSKKIQAICSQGLALPPQFTLPMLPVFDPTGRRAVGFQMRRIPASYHKLKMLLDGSFRTSHQVGLRMIAQLFADLFDDLGLLHGKGLVVGDVNLGCVMFQPDGSRVWVDTGSWGFPGFPCLATTELFAHPDLYPNLEENGTHVSARPHHDRFAFLVAFSLMAIPGAHPFKMGTHPTVKGIQNRANAGLTIYDPGVTFPAMIGAPEMLSDEVLHALVERLKRRVDSPLDPDMLRAFALEVTGCKKCGAEYHTSRRQCPKCQEITLVQVPVLTSFLIEELFKTQGVLLFAQLVEKDLYLVCRLGGTVQVVRIDEHGASTILSPELPSIPGARYRFFKNCLVVCPNPSQPAPAVLELYRIEGSNLRRLQGTATGVLEGETAVFDTTSRFLYRVAGNTLVRSDLFGPAGVVFDEPVAEVHQRQSWFTADHATNADREVIFGYDRALRNWEWFIIHGNAKGSRYQYHKVGDLGIRTGETVEDFAVYFSKSSVLLVMQTSFNGRDYVRYAVIGLDGKIHQNQTIGQSDPSYEPWSNLRGKLYQGKSILHATPSGIVKQQLSDGSCTTLADTTGKVSIDDQLIRVNGRVGIVRRSGILTMTSKK